HQQSAHEPQTFAPRTKTQLRPLRTVPDPVAPRAVLLQQNQTHPRTVGAPAPGANTCPPHSHRGGAPTTKPNPTPNRRSTRPGCECVPDPFAPRRCSYNKTKPNPDPYDHPPRLRTRARRFAPRRCSYGVLQPHRIPMRIILHRLHQPRPDRVGYDISGQRLEVIVPAHRPIMKTPLPYTP